MSECKDASIRLGYTVPEVAKFLRVDQRTVRNLIDREELYSLRVGKLHRIPAEAIRKYLQLPPEHPLLIDHMVRQEAEQAAEFADTN